MKEVITKYSLQFGFKTSNNEAEYKALIAGLNITKQFRVERLKVLNDSQLVTS